MEGRNPGVDHMQEQTALVAKCSSGSLSLEAGEFEELGRYSGVPAEGAGGLPLLSYPALPAARRGSEDTRALKVGCCHRRSPTCRSEREPKTEGVASTCREFRVLPLS